VIKQPAGECRKNNTTHRTRHPANARNRRHGALGERVGNHGMNLETAIEILANGSK
jgi:hypothetical protein